MVRRAASRSRRERTVWDNLQLPPSERYNWLLARSAAKDAVRMLIHDRFGEQLCAADVEILEDASGRLAAEGAWKQWLGVNPVIAIANSSIAGAAAALDAAELAGYERWETLGLGQGNSDLEQHRWNARCRRRARSEADGLGWGAYERTETKKHDLHFRPCRRRAANERRRLYTLGQRGVARSMRPPYPGVGSICAPIFCAVRCNKDACGAIVVRPADCRPRFASERTEAPAAVSHNR